MEAYDYAEWGYSNHLPIVSRYGIELAEKYGGNKEYIVLGAMLHDIADTETDRNNKLHEDRSFEISREVLTLAGYGDSEIEYIY